MYQWGDKKKQPPDLDDHIYVEWIESICYKNSHGFTRLLHANKYTLTDI